jgi:hypothetical protein
MVIKTIDTIDESGAKGVNEQLNAAINDASVRTETKAALQTVMGKQPTANVLATATGAKEDLQKFKREVLQQPTKFTVEAIRTDIHDKIFGVLATYNNADGLNFSADVAALRPAFAPRAAGAPAQTGAPAEEKTLNYDEYVKKNYANADDAKGYKAIFSTLNYWAYRFVRWLDWSKKNPTTNATTQSGAGNNAGQETGQSTALDFQRATSMRGSDLLNANVRAETIQTTARIELVGKDIFVHVITPSNERRRYRVKSTVTSTNGTAAAPKTDFSKMARWQDLARFASIERSNGKIKVTAPTENDKEVDEAVLLRAVAAAAGATYDNKDLVVAIPYTESRSAPFDISKPFARRPQIIDQMIATITMVKA